MRKDQVIQIGMLVRDIQTTAKKWAEFLGIDMPAISLTSGYEETHAVYRGEPCKGRIYQACFEFGNIELELISPAGNEPSFWKECLDRDGEGLHHIAFYSTESAEDLRKAKKKGYQIVQKGEWKAEPRNGIYAYVDARADLKCIIEILDYVK